MQILWVYRLEPSIYALTCDILVFILYANSHYLDKQGQLPRLVVGLDA